MLYVRSMKALATDSTAPCTPVALQCEHLRNPLGIDNPTPRLAWRLLDPRQGARQTAYRVVVGTDSAAVAQGKGNVWDSGRRPTPDMLLTYDGPALQPLTRYYWQVRVWDKDQMPSTSETASFETGLMQTHPWQGTWIDDGHDIHYRPAPYFRKTFRAPKPILRARAYIAAAGLYELHINGRRIGNHRLDPLYTRFDRRNLYVTYDVTPQLQPGDNTIGVLLGNGWYNHQSLAVWDFHRAPWRNRPAFLLNLRITYTDGTTETLATGPDWKTSSAGPLVYNSIYTGEHYDARLEQQGWDTSTPPTASSPNSAAPPTAPTSPTSWATPPTAPNARKTDGPATATSPSKQPSTTTTASPSTKNGWPTTATNNAPTESCPTSSPQADGATAPTTDWTGPAASPSSPGTSTSSTATANPWPTATTTSNAT